MNVVKVGIAVTAVAAFYENLGFVVWYNAQLFLGLGFIGQGSVTPNYKAQESIGWSQDSSNSY